MDGLRTYTVLSSLETTVLSRRLPIIPRSTRYNTEDVVDDVDVDVAVTWARLYMPGAAIDGLVRLPPNSPSSPPLLSLSPQPWILLRNLLRVLVHFTESGTVETLSLSSLYAVVIGVMQRRPFHAWQAMSRSGDMSGGGT